MMEMLFLMINARFQSSNTRIRRTRQSLEYLLDADLLSSKQRFAGTSSMTSEFAPQIIVRIYDEPSGLLSTPHIEAADECDSAGQCFGQK